MTSAIGRARGFTLLELLVVLAILVLVTTAMPFAFNRVFPRQKLKLAAQDLATQLRALREEAGYESKATEFAVADFREDGISLLIDSTIGDAGKVVRFHPDGSTSGGRLVLTSHGQSSSVTVSALTGRVMVMP